MKTIFALLCIVLLATIAIVPAVYDSGDDGPVEPSMPAGSISSLTVRSGGTLDASAGTLTTGATQDVGEGKKLGVAYVYPSSGGTFGITASDTANGRWLADGTDDEDTIEEAGAAAEMVILKTGTFNIQSSDLDIAGYTLKGERPSSEYWYTTATGSILSLSNGVEINVGVRGRFTDSSVKCGATYAGVAVNVNEAGNSMLYLSEPVARLNIYMPNNSQSGSVGIKFLGVGNASHAGSINGSYIPSIHVEFFEKGIWVYADDVTNQGYFNSNTCPGWVARASKYPLIVESSADGATNGNTWTGLEIQATATGAGTVDGVTLTNADYNNFFGPMFWDWADASGDVISVDADSSDNQFKGYLNSVSYTISDSGTNNHFDDTGNTNNMITVGDGGTNLPYYHFSTLSAALTYAGTQSPTSSSRWTILIYGYVQEANDVGVITFKNYVDIVGFNAVVDLTDVDQYFQCTSSSKNCIIRDVTFIKTGTSTASRSVLNIQGSDDTTRFINCKFDNQLTGAHSYYAVQLYSGSAILENCTYVHDGTMPYGFQLQSPSTGYLRKINNGVATLVQCLNHADILADDATTGHIDFDYDVPEYSRLLGIMRWPKESLKDTAGNNTWVKVLLGDGSDDDRFDALLEVDADGDTIWNETTKILWADDEFQGSDIVTADTTLRMRFLVDDTLSDLVNGTGAQGVMLVGVSYIPML